VRRRKRYGVGGIFCVTAKAVTYKENGDGETPSVQRAKSRERRRKLET